jgi:CBS domain-containing protein
MSNSVEVEGMASSPDAPQSSVRESKLPADRAGEFIQLFNQVEKFLSRLVNRADYMPFGKLVEQASTRNAAVRANASTLGQFAKLRNAIVHDEGYPLHIVAMPSPEALAKFRQVVREVIEPTPLIPAFARQVHCFSPGETLSAALEFMRQNDFSQIMVREVNGRLGMISVEGIAWYLADSFKGIAPPAEAATIGGVLALEPPGAFSVMSATRNVFDAADAFRNSIHHDSTRLYAIVITENGDLSEKPIGFVTPWDLVHNPRIRQ